MDDALTGLVLLILAAVLAGPVLAIVALYRLRRMEELRRRVAELEIDFSQLRRRLPESERATSEPGVPVAPVPEPPPAPEPTPEPVPTPRTPETPVPPRATTEVPPTSGSVRPEPEETPPADEAPSFDWERWVGVRGAALLGAIAFALAGLLFFKYSIDRGLITPTMRVVLGTFVGLGSLIGAEFLRRQRYRYAAEGVSGAGVVILYAAFWAAHVLYGLIGMAVTFGLMILVTAACCALALRHASLVVAVLGLVGGFATPLLLSSGSDRPIGLFGYVLLLDLGLLAVGRRQRWPSLGILSLLGTVLLQALWVGARMGPDRLFLALIILAVFAVLFVLTGRRDKDGEGQAAWQWNRIGAVLFPFTFALYFAARVDLGPRLYPIALLLGLLSAAACWVSAAQRVPALGVGAAAGSMAVVGVWLIRHTPDTSGAWETVAVTVGLAALFHVFVERDPQPAGLQGPAAPAVLAGGGAFLLTFYGAATAPVAPWPWVVGWVALSALAYRHATFPDRGWLQIAAGIGFGLGLSVYHRTQYGQDRFPDTGVFLALLVLTALAFQAVALLRRTNLVRDESDQASAAMPIVALVPLTGAALLNGLAPWPALGATLMLGVLAAIAATRLWSGPLYAGAAAATAMVHFAWTSSYRGTAAVSALLGLSLAAVIFTVWPVLTGGRFGRNRVAWYAAALAGPAWFLPLLGQFEDAFGDGFVGAVPVALGALSLAVVARARGLWSRDDPIRLSAIVWLSAVALSFVAIAIPLQLEREWITIGWALEGLALVALWVRLDHPGLKYFAMALLGAATARLVLNPAVFEYYPRSGVRIVNWLLYTYLVPAAALVWSSVLLRPHETRRVRGWEAWLYSHGHAVGSIAAGFAGIAVVFVWINLAIADWFATGPSLELGVGDQPAQRLTVSIAWALYALALLGLGMARASLGLRWLSLAFLLITIGKVFLYDLGALEDLYRVASLVGLAISLILVSLLYQRFVFGRTRVESG